MLRGEMIALRKEREEVRGRVEKMLKQIDALVDRKLTCHEPEDDRQPLALHGPSGQTLSMVADSSLRSDFGKDSFRLPQSRSNRPVWNDAPGSARPDVAACWSNWRQCRSRRSV